MDTESQILKLINYILRLLKINSCPLPVGAHKGRNGEPGESVVVRTTSGRLKVIVHDNGEPHIHIRIESEDIFQLSLADINEGHEICGLIHQILMIFRSFGALVKSERDLCSSVEIFGSTVHLTDFPTEFKKLFLKIIDAFEAPRI